MGQENITAGKKEATGVGNVTTPGEWGETLGAARPPEWALIPTEWSGRRRDARPTEWRKTLGIGGQGRGQERVGGGERPQGHERGEKGRCGGGDSEGWSG